MTRTGRRRWARYLHNLRPVFFFSPLFFLFLSDQKLVIPESTSSMCRRRIGHCCAAGSYIRFPCSRFRSVGTTSHESNKVNRGLNSSSSNFIHLMYLFILCTMCAYFFVRLIQRLKPISSNYKPKHFQFVNVLKQIKYFFVVLLFSFVNSLSFFWTLVKNLISKTWTLA